MKLYVTKDVIPCVLAGKVLRKNELFMIIKLDVGSSAVSLLNTHYFLFEACQFLLLLLQAPDY